MPTAVNYYRLVPACKEVVMFERTYDGRTWEEVSEAEMRQIFKGYYKDVDVIVAAMRQDPKVQAPTFGASYRYRAEEAPVTE